MITAAGILIRSKSGEVLFLRRAEGGDHAGTWCIPGGKRDGDETIEECAEREAREEIGPAPYSNPVEFARRIRDDVDFTTYLATAPSTFTPTLSDEHTGFCWALPSQPPMPLHPGMGPVLAKLTGNELDIARLMQAGELTSPQRFANIWLFDLRITGTGSAYREGLKEHTWREPAMYLNAEFLQRCQGLPVVWEHPDEQTLTTKEYRKRVVGAIMWAYIKPSGSLGPDPDLAQGPNGAPSGEVWGIARINDGDAAQIMAAKQLSTSPSVVIRRSESTELATDDGQSLLIEGSAFLLDHLAVCELGVWDKGGEPSGIRVELVRGDSQVAEPEMIDDKARKDGEGESEGKQILNMLDAICSRLDASDKSMSEMRTRMDALTSTAMTPLSPINDAFSARKDAESDDDYKARYDAAESKAAEEMIAKGEPKETAADKARKARKDAEEKDKERHMADKARKDAEEAEAARKRADATRADSDRVSALERQLAELRAQIPREISDEESAKYADHQARADRVYSAFGKQAPRFMAGETLMAYRKRLLKEYQGHSKDFAKVNLLAISDPAVLDIAEERILADALAAARSPTDVPVNELREIRSRDETGRTIRTFAGRPSAWMGEFKSPARRVTGINKDR